ncbi:MAG: MDR family oxidoreductase [Microbacteriaceae bacterium]
MRALWVSRQDDGTLSHELRQAMSETDIPQSDVRVAVEYSSINFKDGLALTGRPGVIRADQLIPGIDLVGYVTDVYSADSPWVAGDRVLINGWGIGETHHGGLAQIAHVRSDWLEAVPDQLSNLHAAAIGTAGFTAMLAVLAIERHGIRSGKVLVTGAAGGVGSITVSLLSTLGYEVAASTGRGSEHEYLRALGATDILDRASLNAPGKPLQAETWDAVIDSVGSHTLANALAQTRYGGVVASCGLAQGSDLPTTVMPFILRGVTLAGINSVYCPSALRREAWVRLAKTIDVAALDSLTSVVALEEAPHVAERIISGAVRGRTVVDVQN